MQINIKLFLLTRKLDFILRLLHKLDNKKLLVNHEQKFKNGTGNSTTEEHKTVQTFVRKRVAWK